MSAERPKSEGPPPRPVSASPPPGRGAVSPRRAPPPVLAKTHDLIGWFIPRLADFPKALRFGLGDRILAALLDVLEGLVQASYTRDRAPLLDRVNLRLEVLRHLVRLAHGLGALATRRYEYAAREIDELGRQVGGWRRASSPPS